jgi:hypothetical protein
LAHDGLREPALARANVEDARPWLNRGSKGGENRIGAAVYGLQSFFS